MNVFFSHPLQIIAPGSHTTLAQLGLPESFTPARHRFPSRMFPAEKPGEWEPHKVRRKPRQNGVPDTTVTAITSSMTSLSSTDAGGPEFEEDLSSQEGAVWPIKAGGITNWDCFFALLEHIHTQINPPWHTPILLVTQPVWTPKEHEKITGFFFEKFKCPGLALVDAAIASCYAHGLETACVVDVGADKADITAIREFIPSSVGRGVAVEGCGGEALTGRLFELLAPKKFSRAMCEQLKKSNICEILPPGNLLPGSQTAQNGSAPLNAAAAASTGAQGPGPKQRHTVGSEGQAPRGLGHGAEIGGDYLKDVEDSEGVLDVASIVAGGKMNEFLAKKEKEKQEALAAKKKGGDAAVSQPKQVRLRNSEKERNTFFYEDHALMDALKGSDMNSNGIAEAKAAFDDATNQAIAPITQTLLADARPPPTTPSTSSQPPRREISVGTERFQAATGPMLTLLSDAIYRTVHSHPRTDCRPDLWNNIIIVGNGAAVRGFKDALLTTLNSRFLISPSSATMFTSELPSNFSTPVGTGSQTPVGLAHGGHGSGVNPLLHAATRAAASGAGLAPPQLQAQQSSSHATHSSHAQAPTSVKVATLPEYFPEWKDAGSEEAAFLGAQVAARVLYVVNSGTGSDKGYMSRSEYNENGPSGIHDYSMSVA